MTPHKGYYSLVQYCPDLGRFEAANIGVILFCPETGFLKAITSGNNSRISRFFGSDGHDWKRINTIKKALHDRLAAEHHDIRSPEDFQRFIATRANLLQITNPLPMKVKNAEQDLVKLYEQILGSPAKRERPTNLRKLVGDRFSAAGLESRILSNIRVEVPVLGREVELPFGFQNGRFNLINPVRFCAADPGQSFGTACKFAVEGRSIYDHPDSNLGPLQLVVVGQFRTKDDPSLGIVRRVFDESHVKLYSSDNLHGLIDEIRRTGKVINSSK